MRKDFLGKLTRIRTVSGSTDVTPVYEIIVSNGTLIDNGNGTVTITTGGGGGGSGFNIQELDGIPSGTCTTLIVPNTFLTDNGGGQFTLTFPATYTDEQAQDAVGTILTDTSEIDLTYNDSTPSISAAVISIAQSKITNLTTDLSNKQPLDATLTSLAAYNTKGIVCRATVPATGTWQFGMSINWTEIAASAFD